jgi:hypothetical protein
MWERLFDQLEDGFENLLNIGIMALVLLFEVLKFLGEFPVCAERLSQGSRITEQRQTLFQFF